MSEQETAAKDENGGFEDSPRLGMDGWMDGYLCGHVSTIVGGGSTGVAIKDSKESRAGFGVVCIGYRMCILHRPPKLFVPVLRKADFEAVSYEVRIGGEVKSILVVVFKLDMLVFSIGADLAAIVAVDFIFLVVFLRRVVPIGGPLLLLCPTSFCRI